MQLFFEIIKNDLKLIFRDKSLIMIFIVPVPIVLVCRIGIPQLAAIVPELPDYYWLIVAAFTSVTASTPSFLTGFILLDERDENIHTMLKILPLPENFILKSRVFFMVFLGFIFSLFILSLNGLVHFGVFQILAIAVLYSLIPPVLTFSITTFARNKIEAATLYKGLSVILFVPVIAFFMEGNLKYLFGVIPFFWTFETMREAVQSSFYMFSFLISLSIHILFTILLYRLYKNRIL